MQVSLLIFCLDEGRYAISLAYVDKVYPAVSIAKPPDNKDDFLGFVNVHGTVVPVINLRARFGLPAKEIAIEDMLVLAHDQDAKLAFVVDSIEDVIEYSPEQLVIADSLVYASSKVKVLNLNHGLVMVSDLSDYLSESARQYLAGS